MRLPWLHPHRVEVLTALALVADQGQDLLPGFRRLAGEDPDLRRWVGRLAPLERGEPLVPLLRRLRLVDRHQGAYLEARSGAAGYGRALANCARGNRGTLPGMGLLRWYPLWIMVALLAVPVLGVNLLEWYSGHALQRIFGELGVRLSGLGALVLQVEPQWQLLTVVAVVGAMALLLLACHATPWLPVLLAIWAPAVWREAAACRLVHLAECERWERAPWYRRLFARLRRSGETAPAWAQDWRVFWFLSCLKIPRSRRVHAEALADELGLVGRLRALGLVPMGARGVEAWDEAAERCRERYRVVRDRQLPWMRTVLVAAAVWAFYSAALSPLFDLVNALGGAFGRHGRDLDVALWLLMASGITLVVAAWGSIPWPPSLVFAAGGNQPAATRQLCLAVAAAVRRREDLGEALEALYPSLPLIYRFRIASAVRRLREEGGQPVSLVLGEELVLPPELGRSLAAAEILGPEALAREAEAEALRLERSVVGGGFAALLIYLYAFLLAAIFIGVFIAPKFVRIFDDLGITPTTSTRILQQIGSQSLWLMLMLVGLVLVPIAWAFVVWLWHAWAPGGRRLRRGRLLVAGCGAGLDEGALAGLVEPTWRQAPPALWQAARRGDLAGLIAACGWSAADPTALAVAVERHEWRAWRWYRIRKALLVVLLPLAMAFPVLLFAEAVLGSILQVIEILLEDL